MMLGHARSWCEWKHHSLLPSWLGARRTCKLAHLERKELPGKAALHEASVECSKAHRLLVLRRTKTIIRVGIGLTITITTRFHNSLPPNLRGFGRAVLKAHAHETPPEKRATEDDACNGKALELPTGEIFDLAVLKLAGA